MGGDRPTAGQTTSARRPYTLARQDRRGGQAPYTATIQRATRLPSASTQRVGMEGVSDADPPVACRSDNWGGYGIPTLLRAPQAEDAQAALAAYRDWDASLATPRQESNVADRCPDQHRLAVCGLRQSGLLRHNASCLLLRDRSSWSSGVAQS